MAVTRQEGHSVQILWCNPDQGHQTRLHSGPQKVGLKYFICVQKLKKNEDNLTKASYSALGGLAWPGLAVPRAAYRGCVSWNLPEEQFVTLHTE